MIAPKRVAEHVWPTEAALWRPDLHLELAVGTPSARYAALERPADITVLGRDVLADAFTRSGKFNTIVLDEASGFKNRASQRFKVAKKLVPGVPFVWELSGTPSPNGLMDLWSQIFLLDGGKRLGKTLTAYRERYFRPGARLHNGVVTEWIPRPGSDAAIHELLSDICLSMSGEGRLDLPPVTHNRVHVPLTPAARKVYKTLAKELVVDLDLLGDIHTASNAASLTSKLSQITAGFIYSDEMDGAYDVVHRDSIGALQEIVEGTGSPVLVFYRFIR